jgi:tRNA(Ile)-lysidine synthase TilS/MesJ
MEEIRNRLIDLAKRHPQAADSIYRIVAELYEAELNVVREAQDAALRLVQEITEARL